MTAFQRIKSAKPQASGNANRITIILADNAGGSATGKYLCGEDDIDQTGKKSIL